MVYCCVPQCGTDSWRCDPSITFHDFPSSPDLASKWIQQINNAIKSDRTWFPRGESVLCSKHFLSTDFKDDSDTLKPRVVPTVFGYKYIGQNPEVEEIKQPQPDTKPGPLIVKIKTEDGGSSDIFISGIHPQISELDAIINEPDKSILSDFPLTSNTVKYKPSDKTYERSKMGVKQRYNPISTKNAVPKKSINVHNKTLENNMRAKKSVQKRDNNDNLIEIGHNTFLKINPDIIKVNKKLTPSGNTVLQFLMDQNLANTIGADVLPKIVQGAISNIGEATTNLMKNVNNPSLNEKDSSKTEASSKKVQHVLGHIVDTHVCKESCEKLKEIDNMLMDTDNSLQDNICPSNKEKKQQSYGQNSLTSSQNQLESKSNLNVTSTKTFSSNSSSEITVLNEKADSACIAKAPVLLTTNMSLAHCFMEKTRYLSHLRQKSRQIASLKVKITNLNKKIEELEDKCIVQERQLSLSFLKKLRNIRKNANKGDPPATYILEQIRAYSGQKQMRWSDSTLHQCAIWCKKAPYAYEYFKKADFFKLPCLGTVKRFMKKHPEMTFSNKSSSNVGNKDDDSSSDFDFDEEDSSDEEHDKDNQNENIVCETVLSEENSNLVQLQHSPNRNSANPVTNANNQIEVTSEINEAVQNIKVEKADEVKSLPVTVDGNNLELQEIVLPSGEVVQCYGSNLCNQYYIIPSSGDQNSTIDSEYSIVQSADSVPVVLKNSDGSQMQQEQLIFITNSTDQVECTETEVVTDR